VHPLVAFIKRASNGDVLQALALPFDACATHGTIAVAFPA